MNAAPEAKWRVHPAAEVLPLLEGAEFNGLVEDIRKHGLRTPICLDRDGRILDGRNRLRACELVGIEPRFETYKGDDPLAYVVSMNRHRRHLNDSQRAMSAARIANLGEGRPSKTASIEAVSQPEAAEIMRVSRPSVQRATRVLADGAEELVAAVDQGRIKVSDAASVAQEPHATQRALLGMVSDGKTTLKAARRTRDLDRQRLDIIDGRVALPEGLFEVIVIDPPRPYEGAYSPGHWMGRVQSPYPSMTLEQLAALQMPAADDSILWLWTTHRFMPDAFDLLRAWGFEHMMVLTWVKHRMGIGHWLRSKSEFCIMAVRGSPKVNLTNQTTVLEAPAREHSRKPEEFYDLIESLSVASLIASPASRGPAGSNTAMTRPSSGVWHDRQPDHLRAT